MILLSSQISAIIGGGSFGPPSAGKLAVGTVSEPNETTDNQPSVYLKILLRFLAPGEKLSCTLARAARAGGTGVN